MKYIRETVRGELGIGVDDPIPADAPDVYREILGGSLHESAQKFGFFDETGVGNTVDESFRFNYDAENPDKTGRFNIEQGKATLANGDDSYSLFSPEAGMTSGDMVGDMIDTDLQGNINERPKLPEGTDGRKVYWDQTSDSYLTYAEYAQDPTAGGYPAGSLSFYDTNGIEASVSPAGASSVDLNQTRSADLNPVEEAISTPEYYVVEDEVVNQGMNNETINSDLDVDTSKVESASEQSYSLRGIIDKYDFPKSTIYGLENLESPLDRISSDVFKEYFPADVFGDIKVLPHEADGSMRYQFVTPNENLFTMQEMKSTPGTYMVAWKDAVGNSKAPQLFLDSSDPKVNFLDALNFVKNGAK